MALVTRSSGQLIQSTDVDQYHDLLTGAMTDQNVTLANNQFWKARGAAPGAATATVAAGGSIDVGAHDYVVTFVGPNSGETLAGTHVTATTTTGNQTVNLSVIPTGPAGTSSRNIYRSKVGTTSPLFLLHTIADNTTTTYSDTATDASLPATQPPVHPSFGGSTQWQDNTGAVKAQIFSDGAVSFDAGGFTTSGGGSLTLSGTIFSGTLNFNSDGAYVTHASASHWNEYKSSASGAASGHIFSTWDGAVEKIPFSIGGQFASALAWVDNSGTGVFAGTQITGRNGFGGTNPAITFSSGSHVAELWSAQSGGSAQGWVFNTWNGSAAVNCFSVGGQYDSALSWVDNSGNYNGPAGGGIPTTRNGTATSVPIFTGTGTPSSPPTGSIWIKA